MKKLFVLLVLLLISSQAFSLDPPAEGFTNPLLSKSCSNNGIWLQVLGSGGPELTDQRASTGYLIWVDGKSRVLVDAGGGTAFNFERADGNFSDLDMILLSHLHVDHSADLPAFIKGSYFINRKTDLPIVGPIGNDFMPSTEEYGHRLFETGKGAYQYLGDYMHDDKRESASYRIHPQNYLKPLQSNDKTITASAVSVTHGPLPALAWRLDIEGQSIVFSGDMAKGGEEFSGMLKDVDMFVAHNAIPEGTKGVGRKLHLPPSVIGEYASQSEVDKLILSHRMTRTLGDEDKTLEEVRKKYSGSIEFANDLDCFEL